MLPKRTPAGNSLLSSTYLHPSRFLALILVDLIIGELQTWNQSPCILYRSFV